MVALFFFIFGLIIGSFLNVVVYRLKTGETLLGRSYCHQCGHQIRWYDNIPVLSFILLGGKCRDCHVSLSWQYPMLETVTGLCFAIVSLLYFDISDQRSWMLTTWLLITVSILLAIATYDILYMEIPIVLLLSVLGVTFLYLLVTFSGKEAFWSGVTGQSLLGAISIGTFFFGLVFFSRETWMGWGDVWLGALAGLIVGLPAVLLLMTLSFGSGAIIGIGMTLFGGKGLKTQIPFAPYLVLGTLLTLFLPEMYPEVFRSLLL